MIRRFIVLAAVLALLGSCKAAIPAPESHVASDVEAARTLTAASTAITPPPCSLPITATEGTHFNVVCELPSTWPTKVEAGSSRGVHWGGLDPTNRYLVVVGDPEDDNIVQGSWDINLTDLPAAGDTTTLVRVEDDDTTTVHVSYRKPVPEKLSTVRIPVEVWYYDFLRLGTADMIVTYTGNGTGVMSVGVHPSASSVGATHTTFQMFVEGSQFSKTISSSVPPGEMLERWNLSSSKHANWSVSVQGHRIHRRDNAFVFATAWSVP